MSSKRHSGHMTHPAEAILEDSSLNPGERCLRDYLVASDVALPTNAKDSSEFLLMEQLQTDVPMIQGLCLACIQNGGEDHAFGSYGETMIVKDPVQEHSIHSMSCFQ